MLRQPPQPRYKSSQRGVETVVMVVTWKPVGDWVVMLVTGLR